MAGTGPDDLHALAVELLDACVESLDSIPTFNPGLAGAPDRRFVSPGLPVWDCCEMLTVHVDGLSESGTSPGGLATGRRQVYNRINLAALVVTMSRCIPVIGGTQLDALPEPAALQSAAEQLNADGWALWNHLFNMIRNDELFEKCLEIFWDGMRAVVPSGGCAGWQTTFRVQLDGYED